MKIHFPKVYQLLFLSTFLIIAGCKDKKSQESKPVEEPNAQEIEMAAEQDRIVAQVLQANGAAIRLIVTDAQSLFDSEEPSIIDEKHPDLKYISMQSQGQKPEHRAETSDSINAKNFESSVYIGQPTVWRLRLDQRNPNNRNYTIEIQEIDFRVDPDNPCQAYEKVRYPRGNNGLVNAQVSDEATVGCKQPYFIIFSLHHNDQDISRTFVLDPWVLVR